MPGANCSIYGCSTSRRHKGVSIFKIPASSDSFNTSWRKNLIAIILKDRIEDCNLKAQIESKSLFICEKHYLPEMILHNNNRKSLKPGSLPTMCLPKKGFMSSIPVQRESASSIIAKRDASMNSNNIITFKPIYKSYEEFTNRISKLKICDWTVSVSLVAEFKLYDTIHLCPRYEIYVDDSLAFTIRVYSWLIPDVHSIYTKYRRSMRNISASNLISVVTSFSLCSGITNIFSLKSNLYIKHCISKKFNLFSSRTEFPLNQTEYFRSQSCIMLIDLMLSCSQCKSIEKSEIISLKKNITNACIPAKLNAPIKFTSPDRLKLTLQSVRLENKELKMELALMKQEIENSSLTISKDTESDLVKIMSGADKSKISPFMNLFWEEQQKYLKSSKQGIRYHPAIIRYCLGLAAKSPAAYEALRLNDKNNSGFLILPSRRRLRDYKNYVKPKLGFNKNIITELKDKIKDFSAQEKFIVLVLDEMKIQENLVWDKHSGELIGYVDLGDPSVNFATLQQADKLASHVLVFLIRSVVNPFKYSFANFATINITSVQLFPLFWKAVGILEISVGLKVVAVTCDGASSNRKFFKMHFNLTEKEDRNGNVDVTYRTDNLFADDGDKRFIYFISDVPHLIKTARNSLSHSGAGKSNRYMWNQGQHILWSHITDLFYEDLKCQLHACPKLTVEHIKITPFSAMNVRLAAQVLSNSCSTALEIYAPSDTSGTAQFCKYFNDFFDCLNVRNKNDYILKRNSFLKPFSDTNDVRFTWLKENFLKYLSDWFLSIESRPGKFSKSDRSNMFITWQTHEGLKITVNSIVELVSFLINSNVSYVLTERFCQDPLENYFGQQRSIGKRKDNPSLFDFGFNDNTIRNQHIFHPIAGNCLNINESNRTTIKESMSRIPRRKWTYSQNSIDKKS